MDQQLHSLATEVRVRIQGEWLEEGEQKALDERLLLSQPVVAQHRAQVVQRLAPHGRASVTAGREGQAVVTRKPRAGTLWVVPVEVVHEVRELRDPFLLRTVNDHCPVVHQTQDQVQLQADRRRRWYGVQPHPL